MKRDWELDNERLRIVRGENLTLQMGNTGDSGFSTKKVMEPAELRFLAVESKKISRWRKDCSSWKLYLPTFD